MTYLSKPLITLAAALFYGAWALYSNWMEGTEAQLLIAWRAAVIQGCYAGLLTAANMYALEWAYLRYIRRHSVQLSRFFTISLITTLQYGFIIPIHWVNQTPNIALTLFPGFVIGLAFSTLYLLRHSRPAL